jgi:hypothetical protein
MYLSDLLVAANKEGGKECVKQTVSLLTRLPSDWWNVRGCKNWLVVAQNSLINNQDIFFSKLEEYSQSQDWASGKSFQEVLKDA